MKLRPKTSSVERRASSALLVLLLATVIAFAAEPSLDSRTSTPAFEEVYQVLRKNLTGVGEAELEQAAIKGLLNQLYPLVSIATNNGPHPGEPVGEPLAATSILEGAYAYFRFNHIAEDADKEFSTAFKRVASTNRLRGLILDLRFADGVDYGAAAALADPFLPARQPMIDWGDGLRLSTTKTNPVHLPLAILMNKETRGAAEAFAAILRRSDIGILLGDNTAGQAFLSREFTLKNGQKLSIATTPVKIASGQPISRTGVAPDIKVEVPLAEERAYLQDAYRQAPRLAAATGPGGSSSAGLTNQTASGTNRARRRINEADLVRMQREGIDLDADFPTGREAGPLRPPVITDPVLARAVDLLKALSLVQHSRGAGSR